MKGSKIGGRRGDRKAKGGKIETGCGARRGWGGNSQIPTSTPLVR